MIPNNLEEAFDILNNELSKEDKKYILENGAISVHRSLGRWIRNEWHLWTEETELKRSIQNLGYQHPDDISNYIIEKYIKHLKDVNT